MPNAIKWEAVWASRGTVLTTELNALANAAFSAIGTEIDNGTNLDMWGKVVVVLASLSPTAGAYLELHMVTAPDGTNYCASPGTNNPSPHTIVAVMGVDTTATSAKRVESLPFLMQPGKTKFHLKNACGVALGATLNTVTLFTTNEELQ